MCDTQKLDMFRALELGTTCFMSEPVVAAQTITSEPIPDLTNGKAVFYVSPTGSDQAKGTSMDKPLKTLDRAVELSRASSIGGATSRHIYMMSGVHRFTQTVSLGPQDSNLTIQGLDGAILSAAQVLPQFEWRSAIPGTRIYVADLTNVATTLFGDLSRLYISGETQVRARSPNVNTYAQQFRFAASGNIDSWPHKPFQPVGKNIRQTVVNSTSGLFRYQIFDYGVGGQCTGMYDPPVGYWCDPKADGDSGCPLDWPSGVVLKDSIAGFINLKGGWTYNTSAPGYFHALQLYKWGGWTFEISQASTKTINFGKGGFQEARGDCTLGGSDFYLENVFELLDYWGEYLLDLPNRKLFSFQDAAPNNLPMELGVKLTRIIQVVGTSANPVRNLQLLNLIVERTYATHMEPHEMPSGGDVAIHRGGAVFLEGVEDVMVADCIFRNLGSNGLFISKYARRVNVLRNEFAFLEGSPMVLVGDPLYFAPEPWDRRNDVEHISGITIKYNLMHDLGLVEMQSCPILLSICANVLIEQNVMYNGPRGAVVLNDIYGGNIVVRRNVIFGFVQLTWDHGPYNVWDRQQWLFNPGFSKGVLVEWNYIIGTADGQKLIDLDDGARDHQVFNNILIDGYIKYKGYNHLSTGNVIVGLHPEQQWGCLLLTATHRAPASWVYGDNSCYLGGTLPLYTWRSSTQSLCTPIDFLTYGNRQRGFNVNWIEWKCGKSLKDWMNFGQEVDSTFNRDLAPTSTIVDECEQKAQYLLRTDAPTRRPTESPTAVPTASPVSSAPSTAPTTPTTSQPSTGPTLSPTRRPTTASPTKAQPTTKPPTARPTKRPSATPTAKSPTAMPTKRPSATPTTKSPTEAPTKRPTKSPTQGPTKPTAKPTDLPTYLPTASPTTQPTKSPTEQPTALPSLAPTNSAPTTSPTSSTPTKSPTSSTPTKSPTSSMPTTSPTSSVPTTSPTSSVPTTSPTSSVPTASPTSSVPTNSPTLQPTLPTGAPTRTPTGNPTQAPTQAPTTLPTKLPTGTPTGTPTGNPTQVPTSKVPTSNPTLPPTGNPTQPPTGNPTQLPTGNPTQPPTGNPTQPPTGNPTQVPTSNPTQPPTGNPIQLPTDNPTQLPTGNPTQLPTGNPIQVPTGNPTKLPTGNPTQAPTLPPTTTPSTANPSPPGDTTLYPTPHRPSQSPSIYWSPTHSPTTSKPSKQPTTPQPSQHPTQFPTMHAPSLSPTIYWSPTQSPTTSKPSSAPTTPQPTHNPTLFPTGHAPSTSPTEFGVPSAAPVSADYAQETGKRKLETVSVDAAGNNHLLNDNHKRYKLV
ncbi:hypothetical protein BASA81_010011 [Batrachochytrium salamandrivorans]|nr:hypothetical protein BASA81_010011 [Batrachochytrium salamandrivorans]